MRKTHWQLVLLFCIVSIGVWLYKDLLYHLAWGNRGNMPGIVQRALETSVTGPDFTTPLAYSTRIKNGTMLKPDDRLLFAMREMYFLSSGETPDISFSPVGNNNSWRVTGVPFSDKLPELSDFAGFPEIKSYLSAYLKHLPHQSQGTQVQLNTFEGFAKRTETMEPLALITVLSELNQQALNNPINPSLLKIAAKAFIRLVYTNFDLLEISDGLEGKALALLILAQDMGTEPLLLEEGMLAYRMGYRKHAMGLLSQLNDTAWKYYLEKNELQLNRIARDAKPDSLEKYIWLQSFAESDRQMDWWTVITSDYNSLTQSFYALTTGAKLSNFSYQTMLMNVIPEMVYSQVEASLDPGKTKALQAGKISDDENSVLNKLENLIETRFQLQDNSVIQGFEGILTQASQNYLGPYFSEKNYEDYFRSQFFSPYYRLGLHYLDNLNSIEAAEQFEKLLGSADSGAARELHVWYSNLVSAKTGKINVNAVLNDLQNSTSFGLPPLLRTIEAILPFYAFGRPEKEILCRFLMGHMDARVGHRFKFAGLSREHLLDLNRADTIFQNYVRQEESSDQSITVWLGYYADNPEAILQVAENPNLSVNNRAYAAGLLTDFPDFRENVWRVLAELQRVDSEAWYIYEISFKVGEDLNNASEIIRMADVWLNKQHANPNVFNDWKAVIAKSKAQLSQGDSQSAWDTIQPILETQYGPALRHGVDVLLALKGYRSANELAESILERYPDSVPSMGKRLKALWAAQEFKKAADVAGAWKYPSSAEDWRWIIGMDLLDVIQGNRSMAGEIVNTLKAAGVEDWKLRELAAQAGHEKQYEIAYEIQSRLRIPGPGQLNYDLETYKYMKEVEGKENANRWIASRIRPGSRNFSSMILYDASEMDLLWGLIPSPEQEQYGSVVWLYRAAAMLEGHAITEDQKQSLQNYFTNAGNSHYEEIGKYLLGLVPEEKLVSRVMNNREMNEATYYLGIKALSEKRYHDAVDWFRASISTGDYNSGEYRWAYDYLYLIMNKNKSLETLAEKGDLSRL